MGCPMCDWKTALLVVIGFAILLMPLGQWSYAGLGLIVAAWAWALWPKKECRIEPGSTGRDRSRPVRPTDRD